MGKISVRVSSFAPLTGEISTMTSVSRFGLVAKTAAGLVHVTGLSSFARVGDLALLSTNDGEMIAEVVDVEKSTIQLLPEAGGTGVAVGDVVWHFGSGDIYPDVSWAGRIIDSYGKPLDGMPLARGPVAYPVRCGPPASSTRKRLGLPLETGIPALNTFLPLVRGQRIGLFAGSGVGKSTLLASLAQGVEADHIVIALVGERGREVREFIEDTLGESGLKRAVVVAATSDQSAVSRRRAAWTAMATAEYLRNQGSHVLLLVDSVTRFCEAHREIVATTGEAASLRGFPPSTTQALMELCERAGPGTDIQGDITAVFSVLVAGSDMDEPVADMVRGVLDGHIVLDRAIAERGRFPAIDILRSVSRSFVKALAPELKSTIKKAKLLMSSYDDAEVMIQTGLYQPGSDQIIDRAIKARPQFEGFLSMVDRQDGYSAKDDQLRLTEIVAELEKDG